MSSILKVTKTSTIKATIQKNRKFFDAQKTLTYNFRLNKLKTLKKLMQENEKLIRSALVKDLRQSLFTQSLETLEVTRIIEHSIDTLWENMSPEPRTLSPLAQPASGYILSDPLGVVLIIGPWNYPMSTMMKPLSAAIAAGNTVVLKPSEISENCSNMFKELFEKYFEEDFISVITGGVEQTTEVLKQKFDKIFFTGSPFVGKIVMKAASEHLTPCLLELGGKSPCVIDKDCNLAVTANRLVWGKCVNAGQTCIAPDYVLVHEDMEEKLFKELVKVHEKFYGKDSQKSSSYGRIINQRHFARCMSLLKNQTLSFGGKSDLKDLYLQFTIIRDASVTSPVMQQEIFGPILPIVKYKTMEDAINFIRKREKPLALYVFSNNRKNITAIQTKTSSGGMCVNDCLLHAGMPNLPFGGVGNSGMGSYNGKKTFDEFSHKKSVLDKSTFGDVWIRYPPFTKTNMSILFWLQGIKPKNLKRGAFLVAGLIVAVVVKWKWF